MLTLCHDVDIHASKAVVYKAVTTSAGFNAWWTVACKGELSLGKIFSFYFSDDYDWKAEVVECIPDHKVVYRIIHADEDWTGTLLSFELIEKSQGNIILRFEHQNWQNINDHYRRTNYCWAKYFLQLKKFVESTETANK